MGRVTLNPMPHIDLMGTILLPLLLYFSTSGAFLFGYAKPVPVRFDRLRHPTRDMIWVALAGPGSNLVQALLWGVLFYVLAGSGITGQEAVTQLGAMLPSANATETAFRSMGSRPEELMKALNVLRSLPPDALPDEHLPTIAQSLGAAAADVELQKVEAMGPLAEAVFSRICSIGGDVKGVFTGEALKAYAAQIGREVTAQEVQGIIGAMTSANLLMRVKHGHYGVTDPFVEKAWMNRLQADQLLRANLAAADGAPVPGMAPGSKPPAVDKTKVGLFLGTYVVGPSLMPFKDEIDPAVLAQADGPRHMT